MSYDISKENVPGFVKRIGDRVIAGSNNSVIVLGSDRPADIDSGYGHLGAQGGGAAAGSCHIITGREGEDPNPDTDMSYIYLSMRTDVDDNLQLDFQGKTNDVPAAVMKSDAVRLVARENVKISVGGAYIYMKSDGTIVLDGDIQLGAKAQEKLVRGDAFMKLFNGHGHQTAMGPSATPMLVLSEASSGIMNATHLSPKKFTD